MELTLKFWKLETNTWTMITRAHEPHEGTVDSLVFHPTEDLLVTTSSYDKKFKIWKPTVIVETKNPGRQPHLIRSSLRSSVLLELYRGSNIQKFVALQGCIFVGWIIAGYNLQ